MTEIDPSTVQISIDPTPLKVTNDEVATPPAEIETVAKEFRSALFTVDYRALSGTCMDERRRDGLVSGKPTTARPGAPGGPDVYATIFASLVGIFDSNVPADERMNSAMGWVSQAGLKSGGHRGCAAASAMHPYIGILSSDNRIDGLVAHQFELDDQPFDSAKLGLVIDTAGHLVNGSVFEQWDESGYFELLGDDADNLIEEMADREHQGKVMIYNRVPSSLVAKRDNRAFVNDAGYLDVIENAVLHGASRSELQELAPYTRHAILSSLVLALPNPELHHVRFSL